MSKLTIKCALISVLVILAFAYMAPRPSLAQEPVLQLAPMRPGALEPLPPGAGFVPPPMDLSHLKGDRMPEGIRPAALPSQWDWRTQGKVTQVEDQGICGACYAFAALGNFESKILIDGQGTYNFSQNHAKECNWYETANINGGTSCSGGNYDLLASLFSKTGTVLESCDPYVPSDVACNSTCPYQKTLLDWRIISGDAVADTDVLKNYIYTYGPVYTTMYSSFSGFSSYDGSYTVYYTGTQDPNHAVLIVGWDDSLIHAGGTGGWIVKNSWGTSWGDNGYFTIAYGSASIGKYSSFMYGWQNYDTTGQIMYYDEGGSLSAWGDPPSKTGWGLCKFIPSGDGNITRVEFWTTDKTTDVDVYIYDAFVGGTLSSLLASKLNNSFNEAGYHSVALDSPLAATAGDDVVAVVKFTNESFTYPIPTDYFGPKETQRTYISSNGSSWSESQYDVGIRLRTGTGGSSISAYVYLPIILKGGAAGPTPGFWQNDDESVEFYVTADRAYVDDFAVRVYVEECGNYKITHTVPEPISNNQFSFSGSFYASGTFSSNTTASGTTGLNSFYIPGCGHVSGGPWSWDATWRSSAQPSVMESLEKSVSVESVGGQTGEQNFLGATLR